MAAPVSRRTAIAVLGVGSLVATGCDVEDLDPRAVPPTPTVTRTVEAPPPEDEQADLDTLAQVVAESAATLALVEAVARRHPRLATQLDPVAAMHRRHQEILDEAAADPVTPSARSVRPPRRATAALALVRTTEDVTRGRFEAWALDARSRSFARLLAGMSAAVAQQVEVLRAVKP